MLEEKSQGFARQARLFAAAFTCLGLVTCGKSSVSERSDGASDASDDDSNVGGTGASSMGSGGATVGGASSGKGGTDSGAAGIGATSMGGTSTGGAGMGGTNVCVSRESECPELGAPFAPVCLMPDFYCETLRCDPTLDDSLVRHESICDARGLPVTLKRGCGFVTLGFSHPFGSEWQIFDDELGGFVGATYSTDTSYPPCWLPAYETGTEFPECAEAVSCRLCAADSLAPLCRFDCDCDGIEPGIDPCFGPESCECYCSELAATAGRAT